MHSSQIPQQCANDSAETVDGSLHGDGGAGRMVVHGSVWCCMVLHGRDGGARCFAGTRLGSGDGRGYT